MATIVYAKLRRYEVMDLAIPAEPWKWTLESGRWG